MRSRPTGVTLLIVGLTILSLSLVADVIGIGSQPGVIGWKQLLGSLTGIVIGLVGVVLLRGW